MMNPVRCLLFLFSIALLLGACQSAAPPAPETSAEAAAPKAETEAPPAAAMAKSDAPQGDASESEPKTYKNTIKWATASEVDNFGFDVFRGENEEQPFEKINPEVIEGGGTVDEPRRYQFVDNTIDPHKIYYYYVESISMAGVREQFTPIGKVGPKIKPEDEAKPDDGGSR